MGNNNSKETTKRHKETEAETKRVCVWHDRGMTVRENSQILWNNNDNSNKATKQSKATKRQRRFGKKKKKKSN
jgi:hypothetical protein